MLERRAPRRVIFSGAAVEWCFGVSRSRSRRRPPNDDPVSKTIGVLSASTEGEEQSSQELLGGGIQINSRVFRTKVDRDVGAPEPKAKTSVRCLRPWSRRQLINDKFDPRECQFLGLNAVILIDKSRSGLIHVKCIGHREYRKCAEDPQNSNNDKAVLARAPRLGCKTQYTVAPTNRLAQHGHDFTPIFCCLSRAHH